MALPRVSLSHTGFFVFDIDKMLGFYRRVFGFEISDAAEDGRIYFLSADPKDHHQFVMVAGRTAELGKTHFAHAAFRVCDLDELRTLHARLVNEPEASEVRTGTHGNAWSIYFKDPEGNMAEAFVDTPWHVAQPFFRLVENMFDKSNDELVAWTDALLNDDPTKRPFADWRTDQAAKLGLV